MGLFDELLEENDRDGADRPTVNGVALGLVKENWDEKHPGMVRLELMLGAEGTNMTDWVPVAVPYAGNGFGTYFLPEIGSQVVVAFHMGDINCPVVIGSLWNQTDVVPAETAKEGNPVKLIRTKGGNQIRISEESGKERIRIETKGKLSFELDDENQKAELKDENGDNAVFLDAKNGELNIHSKKKMVFHVNGSPVLTLDGSGKSASLKIGSIKLEADQELSLKGQSLKAEGSSTEIKGQNVKIEAQASLGMKGTASFKAESSGMTEVKGSMVKIN